MHIKPDTFYFTFPLALPLLSMRVIKTDRFHLFLLPPFLVCWHHGTGRWIQGISDQPPLHRNKAGMPETRDRDRQTIGLCFCHHNIYLSTYWHVMKLQLNFNLSVCHYIFAMIWSMQQVVSSNSGGYCVHRKSSEHLLRAVDGLGRVGLNLGIIW